MSSFNKTIILGHMTRDPQSRQVAGGTTVTDGGVACNRKFKTADGQDRDEVLFQDFVSFGRTAELLAEHFTKGKAVLLEGHLRTDSWDDKQTGQKRSKNVMVVEGFSFVPDGSGGNGEQRQERAPSPPQRQQQPAPRQSQGQAPQRQPYPQRGSSGGSYRR